MTHTIESLPVLVLNPYSRCNCRCVMCDIWKDTGGGEFAAGELEAQLDSISRLQVKWVVLTGGEPLMHPRLFQLCGLLRGRNVRITLLSTGLLLARHADAVVQNIDDVIVSLDGPAETHDTIRRVPGAFAFLAGGVRALRSRNPNFPIGARCTVQKLNYACLRATVAAARELGLDSVSFLAADAQSTAFNRPEGWSPERQSEVVLTAAEILCLEREAESLIRQGECGKFVLETPEKLRRIVRHFRCHLGAAEPVAPACNAPWVSAVVEADGAVRPCFFHPPIGRLRPGASLGDVLNGPEAVAFRERLDVAKDPICRRCVCSLHYREQ